MPLSEEKASEARFKYRTDPTYAALIDTLISIACPPGTPEPKMHAARDFFLYGVAMVTNKTKRPNLDPYNFGIDGEGGARWTAKVPDALAEAGIKALDLMFQPNEFVWVEADGNLDAPEYLGEGEIGGHEPWLASWARAEVELDNFMRWGPGPVVCL